MSRRMYCVKVFIVLRTLVARAYCANVYVVFETKVRRYVCLLTSKSRVAPLTDISIPRLDGTKGSRKSVENRRRKLSFLAR